MITTTTITQHDLHLGQPANPIMGLSFYPSGFPISVVLTYTVVLRWHSAVPRSLHADIEKNDKNQSGDVDLTRNSWCKKESTNNPHQQIYKSPCKY